MTKDRNLTSRPGCLCHLMDDNLRLVSMAEPLSTHPDFWNPCYSSGRTPWDQGAVPAALQRYLSAHPGRGARALVPGCGSGYEIRALADAGYDVTAIDFSPVAATQA